MQKSFHRGQPAGLRFIRDRLHSLFGQIREDNRLDPVSQFVRSFIAKQTYDQTSWNAFVKLVSRYPNWDAVADAPVADIEAVLGDVAFSEKKAADLTLALQKIRVRAGAINLDFLEDLPEKQALFWLEQIHGVGRKVAASTLNFSTLRKRSFVADSHIVRVLRRFGFVRPKAGIADTYDAVMAAADGFDADGLYELHWYLKNAWAKSSAPIPMRSAMIARWPISA